MGCATATLLGKAFKLKGLCVPALWSGRAFAWAHCLISPASWRMRRFRGPVCPEWLQEQLLSWLIDGAEQGRPGFKEMLTLTPCDIFPMLRGRTLWLMGDSMMQAWRLPVTMCI